MLDQILGWIQENSAIGMLIIFLVACLESFAVLGVIVPGAMFMIAIGGLVAADALNFYWVCLWAILGAIAGDGLSFGLGRYFSGTVYHHPWFKSHHNLIQRSERFVKRHGMASVMLGRFVGPLRAFVPLCVGVLNMSPAKFLLVNVASAILWAPIYMLPGIMAGSATKLEQGHLWWALIWCFGCGWLLALIATELVKKPINHKPVVLYVSGLVLLGLLLLVTQLPSEVGTIVRLISDMLVKHWTW